MTKKQPLEIYVGVMDCDENREIIHASESKEETLAAVVDAMRETLFGFSDQSWVDVMQKDFEGLQKTLADGYEIYYSIRKAVVG